MLRPEKKKKKRKEGTSDTLSGHLPRLALVAQVLFRNLIFRQAQTVQMLPHITAVAAHHVTLATGEGAHAARDVVVLRLRGRVTLLHTSAESGEHTHPAEGV